MWEVRQITFTCNSHAWPLNNIGLNKQSITESIVVDKMPQGIINEDNFLTNSVCLRVFLTTLHSMVGLSFCFCFRRPDNLSKTLWQHFQQMDKQLLKQSGCMLYLQND